MPQHGEGCTPWLAQHAGLRRADRAEQAPFDGEQRGRAREAEAVLSHGGAQRVLVCSLPTANPHQSPLQRDLVPARAEVLDSAAIHRQVPCSSILV